MSTLIGAFVTRWKLGGQLLVKCGFAFFIALLPAMPLSLIGEDMSQYQQRQTELLSQSVAQMQADLLRNPLGLTLSLAYMVAVLPWAFAWLTQRNGVVVKPKSQPSGDGESATSE